MRVVVLTWVGLTMAVPLSGPTSREPWGREQAPAADSCAISRTAHHRGQVERPAALRVGASWPDGWREVTRPLFSATSMDSMAARAIGVRQPRDNGAPTLPRAWVAFVVDANGAVAVCSFGGHDRLTASAPLARRLARLRFTPALMATRPVPQRVVLERAP